MNKPVAYYCQECSSYDCDCWYVAEVARLEIIESAAINLCKVRGRHHSEIAMNKLLKACGLIPTIDEMRNLLSGGDK